MKNIDDFVKSSLHTILKNNGLIYTEQKFCDIFNTFENLAKTSVFQGELTIDSRKEHYEYLFPDLAPKLKNIKAVYENALAQKKDFKFHPSEKIYSHWVQNFLKCPPSKEDCEDLINVHANWLLRITEHSALNINPSELRTWLNKIGIDLSLTSCQFLLEHGFPYCGYLVKPQSIFRLSGNTKSIIGLLAYNLNILKNGSKENPLYESAVLALSRLEYFHNLEYSYTN